MPVARIIQFLLVNGQRARVAHECVLLKDDDRWCALDPENNNKLIKGATTEFLRHEIKKGRLEVELGWDFGEAE